MEIKIEKGKFYFFRINVFGRELDYSGRVTALRDGKFVINTKESCRLMFRLKDVVEVREIEEPKKNLKIVVRKKIEKGGLREVERPEGL